MTATLTEQRHIVLPPEADKAASLFVGQEYHVMISTSGVIVLRPKRKHKKSLAEHFRGLKGLKITRRRDPIPDPIEL